MKKIIPIIILIGLIGYLGYSNYQLNKKVKELQTVQANTIYAMNVVTAFLQETSGGQFSQYVSKLQK